MRKIVGMMGLLVILAALVYWFLAGWGISASINHEYFYAVFIAGLFVIVFVLGLLLLGLLKILEIIGL